MYKILLESPLFNGLSLESIEKILRTIPHQIRQFNSTEILAQGGDKVDKAFLLIEGTLLGEMIDFGGNLLRIEELVPPQMVAAAFLYGPQSRFPVYLRAKTDGALLVIQKKDFSAMLTNQPSVMENYLNIISGKAQFLSGKIVFLSLKTIKEKIAYFLLQKMRNNELTIQNTQSQTSLAELFGVARPSLSRTILEMENQGILSWKKERVEIVDIKLLNQILGR